MYELRKFTRMFLNFFGESWMGIAGAKTRMTDDVQVRGRNHLLELCADGTVPFSCPTLRVERHHQNDYSFNRDLRPDQG
jgi:hypothetical protein